MASRETCKTKGAWLMAILAVVVATGIADPYFYKNPLFGERTIVNQNTGYVRVVATNGVLGFAEAEAYDAASNASALSRRHLRLEERTVLVYNEWGRVVGVFVVGANRSVTVLDDGTVIVSARPVITP